MSDTARPRQHATGTGHALWASMLFYAPIAFEFFYRTDRLDHPVLPPHIVAVTRSVPVDGAETVGMILFAGGPAGFAVGAFQICRHARQNRDERSRDYPGRGTAARRLGRLPFARRVVNT